MEEEDEETDEEEEETEESSVDLLVRFLQSMVKKISKRAKKASRSVLPPAISTQLVILFVFCSHFWSWSLTNTRLIYRFELTNSNFILRCFVLLKFNFLTKLTVQTFEPKGSIITYDFGLKGTKFCP